MSVRIIAAKDARDLSRALDAARSAVCLSGALAPAEAADPDRAVRLARLASLSRLSEALLATFERHRHRADLDEAVQARRQAADLAPPGGPAHSRHQVSLTQSLLNGLAVSRCEADLTEARAAAEAATRRHMPPH